MGTPTRYSQTLWEELQVPGVVPLLSQIRDDLATISQRLQELTATLAALPSAAQSTGGKSIPLPLPALTLPLPPKVLNEMINAANLPGASRMGVFKLTVSVPAGQTVIVTIPVLPGTVHVFMAPLGVTATYYSSQITADVLVDGYDVTPPPNEYQITGDDAIELGQYYYMRIGMTGTITNATASNTLVTFKVEAMAIQKDFFESFYVPLIQHSVDTLKLLANLVTAQGGGS